MRRLHVLLPLLPPLLLALPAMAQAPRAKGAACAAAEARDRLVSVAADGALQLAGLGPVRLAGLRLPEEGLGRAADLLRARNGAEARVRPLGEPDRWGRRPVRLAFDPGLDFGETLVEEGLAIVDPGPGETLCQPELLALEATARERGLGVWAGDGYKPISAGDAARLAGRIGRFALVEGRVHSVGERRQRTYLNFGTEWASDFTLIVPKPAWAALAARGVTAATLRGRTIRVRGILEEWQGTAITVTAAETVEVLEAGRGRR